MFIEYMRVGAHSKETVKMLPDFPLILLSSKLLYKSGSLVIKKQNTSQAVLSIGNFFEDTNESWES